MLQTSAGPEDCHRWLVWGVHGSAASTQKTAAPCALWRTSRSAAPQPAHPSIPASFPPCAHRRSHGGHACSRHDEDLHRRHPHRHHPHQLHTRSPELWWHAFLTLGAPSPWSDELLFQRLHHHAQHLAPAAAVAARQRPCWGLPHDWPGWPVRLGHGGWGHGLRPLRFRFRSCEWFRGAEEWFLGEFDAGWGLW